jgi:hypothetical protein
MTFNDSFRVSKSREIPVFFPAIRILFSPIIISFKTQNKKKRMYQSPLYGLEYAWRNVKNEVHNTVLISV